MNPTEQMDIPWAQALLLISILLLFWLVWNRLRTRHIKSELQDIIDTLDPVALIDSNYNILRVNQVFAASLDRNYASLIGKKCFRVFENRMLPCPGCQLYKTALEKKPHVLPGYRWERDGHVIHYDIAFHPLQDERGKLRGIVEVKKDITHLQAVKQRLEDQKLQLEHKTQELQAKNKALRTARDELQGALAERNRELDLAREIQMSLLPEAAPRLPGLDFWIAYTPVSTVGGDLYDFIDLGDHKLGIFVGDVSGHGLAAAMVSALARMSLYNQVFRTQSPADLFSTMNSDLRQQLRTGHFLTGFFGILDLKTNRLKYVRGSHPPPVVLRVDGSLVRLDARGMLLGVLPSPNYEQSEVQLETGDRFFLFTDGCFEQPVLDGQEPPAGRLNYARFIELLREYGTLPLDGIYGALALRLREFRSATMQDDDDRTFIAMEVTRKPLSRRYTHLLHFQKEDRIHRYRISRRRDIDNLLDQVVNALEREAWSERLVLGICNSIQEVVVNSLVHGHRNDESLTASIAWSVTGKCFRFSVTDRGSGFRPEDVHMDKTHRGHGLLLVRTYMDEVWIDNSGKTISLYKARG